MGTTVFCRAWIQTDALRGPVLILYGVEYYHSQEDLCLFLLLRIMSIFLRS